MYLFSAPPLANYGAAITSQNNYFRRAEELQRQSEMFARDKMIADTAALKVGPTLDMRVKSKIGATSILEDISKIEEDLQFIDRVEQFKEAIQEAAREGDYSKAAKIQKALYAISDNGKRTIPNISERDFMNIERKYKEVDGYLLPEHRAMIEKAMGILQKKAPSLSTESMFNPYSEDIDTSYRGRIFEELPKRVGEISESDLMLKTFKGDAPKRALAVDGYEMSNVQSSSRAVDRVLDGSEDVTRYKFDPETMDRSLYEAFRLYNPDSGMTRDRGAMRKAINDISRMWMTDDMPPEVRTSLAGDLETLIRRLGKDLEDTKEVNTGDRVILNEAKSTVQNLLKYGSPDGTKTRFRLSAKEYDPQEAAASIMSLLNSTIPLADGSFTIDQIKFEDNLNRIIYQMYETDADGHTKEELRSAFRETLLPMLQQIVDSGKDLPDTTLELVARIMDLSEDDILPKKVDVADPVDSKIEEISPSTSEEERARASALVGAPPPRESLVVGAESRDVADLPEEKDGGPETYRPPEPVRAMPTPDAAPISAPVSGLTLNPPVSITASSAGIGVPRDAVDASNPSLAADTPPEEATAILSTRAGDDRSSTPPPQTILIRDPSKRVNNNTPQKVPAKFKPIETIPEDSADASIDTKEDQEDLSGFYRDMRTVYAEQKIPEAVFSYFEGNKYKDKSSVIVDGYKYTTGRDDEGRYLISSVKVRSASQKSKPRGSGGPPMDSEIEVGPNGLPKKRDPVSEALEDIVRSRSRK